MSELIQWPLAKYWDKAWNPVIGCRKCSPACKNCYAEAMMERFGYVDEDGFPIFRPLWTRQKRPQRSGVVFCGNMTDLFGEWLGELPFTSPNTFPDPCSRFVSEVLGNTKYSWKGAHGPTYLWLTKRVERMCETLHDGFVDVGRQWWKIDDLVRAPCGKGCMDNQFFGFTAENQEWFAKRGMEVLKNFPEWANLWVSMEPLLGPIEAPINGLSPLPKWVVVGCESGPNRRPCGMGWVESIVAQCMNAKIPVFVKQLDINGRCETDINKFPAHLRIRQVPWAKKGSEA